MRFDLTRQPFIEVEVFSSTRERGHIEYEFERSKVVEDLVESLEILSDIDDSSNVHFRFGVEIAQGGVKELSIDLMETKEDELVRRMTGEEGGE